MVSAPVILNIGAAVYGLQINVLPSTSYAAEGSINVSCGNRGYQDTVTNEDEGSHYVGGAPSCLADQKAAACFIQSNILPGYRDCVELVHRILPLFFKS